MQSISLLPNHQCNMYNSCKYTVSLCSTLYINLAGKKKNKEKKHNILLSASDKTTSLYCSDNYGGNLKE